ncbi:MAG TPA: MarR family transcriptional regulator [Luteibacter sp.]|uniref:MarR family winged helix-turn-helix transcriptional regulator n=1 Tax=Luteibacter sp. TaxID=1886636 RepID=UPI002B723C19|nr:MarR family transcriptional regulator [Luteibacter sp.]HVI53738.1 MarR family transcriptional regulator [Luteibacter sp.]
MPIIKDSQAGVAAVMAGFDLTFSQLRMLWILDNSGSDLAVTELAEMVSLSLPAAGRAVDGMVRVGLLTRREDEADRRIKRIGLAEPGRETLEKIGRARGRSAERFVEALTEEERADLAGALTTLGVLTRKHFAVPTGASYCSPEKPE